MTFAMLLLFLGSACYRDQRHPPEAAGLLMPTFAHPWFLPLLPIVPLLIVWELLRRRGALRYPETALLAQLPSQRAQFVRWAGATMRAAALTALILALAGPRWPDLQTRIPTDGIAIAMVVDVSGSMNEKDFIWKDKHVTRLQAVKEVFRLFVDGGEAPSGEQLEGRGNDLVGLITYSERPEVACPLTLSHTVMLEQLRNLTAQPEATNIGDAIAWGLDRLRKATPRRKILVLLTDGYHTIKNDKAWKPRPAAQVAANLPNPVIIYTIDAGRESNREGESPAERKAAIKVLQDIANITGGKYFPGDDSQSMLAACQEIDRLERQEVESFQYRRYHEGYPWFGLASFGLLVLVTLLEMTIWRRLP